MNAWIRIAMVTGLSLATIASSPLQAGHQAEEHLVPSVQAMMQRSISDLAAPRLIFARPEEGEAWLNAMSARLSRFIPDPILRRDFLITVHYEASRAGLDPQLILGLIHIESGFRKYAVSPVGARGFMQVMPFWPKHIGTPEHNLFHLRTNLRYGCTILRHYLVDFEKGNLVRALARYNGSLGRTDYPNAVMSHWKRYWWYTPPSSLPVAAPAPSGAPTVTPPTSGVSQ